MSADIAELGKQVRRAKAKAKAAACTAARAWVLTGTVLRTVLIAYLLADGVPYPAVVFLKGKGRQFGWPDKTDEEAEALIDTVFLAADPWEVVALASPDDAPDQAALQRAVDIVHEWRMSLWTLEQNKKSVSPPTAVVLAQFEALRLQQPVGLRPTARGSSGLAWSRKFASRWRKRFNGRSGQMKAREVVPVEILREKARWVR